MQKVVIYGSAPHAGVVQADVAFFSNFSALQFSAREIESIAPIRNNIISAGALRLRATKPDVARKDLELQQIQWTNRIVSAPNLVNDSKAQFYESGFKTVLSQEEIDLMLRSVAGKSPPFIDFSHFLHGRRLDEKRFRKLRRNLVTHLYRRQAGRTSFLNSYFRPSTGIISLVYAIKSFGREYEYEMAGFSFGSRSNHAVFGQDRPRSYYVKHVMADRAILERLQKRFNVTLVGSKDRLV